VAAHAPDASASGRTERERPVDRRNFFTEVVLSLFRPTADYLQSRVDDLKTNFAPLAGTGLPERFLRPPGALPESAFVRRCNRSRRCAEACPVKAIRLLEVDDPELAGTPYIVPSESPCVVCDGLYCMHACPGGALRPVPRHEINMGLATVSYEFCLRDRGEDCQICAGKCPLGEVAITLSAGRMTVLEAGCVGCGVCERHCPTWPKAIVVLPA
jgi:ferredoxin-type protein NapG